MKQEDQYTLVDTFHDKYRKEIQYQIFKEDLHLIKKCLFQSEIYWLKIGESIVLKDSNQKNIYLDFKVSEAKKYGFVIPCAYAGIIDGYSGLACDPDHLTEIETIESIGGAGYEITKKLFKCKQCKQKWLITDEFDSMKGRRVMCSKR